MVGYGWMVIVIRSDITSLVQRLHSLLLLPPTHTKVKRTLSHRHTHTDYFATILYISWYVWYCGVHVVSCYDAVRGKGYLWTSGWFRGGSVSVWVSRPRSLLPPCVFEGRRSLCYLLPVNWLMTEKFGGKKLFCWNWSQAHSWLFSVRAVVWIQTLSWWDNTTCV